MKSAARFNEFPPYTPIEPPEVLSKRLGIPAERIVKLDANENPYGCSPRARAALASLNNPNIYPDPESRALRQALAGFTGIPERFLLAGHGADELIDLLLRVLLEPGDAVLNFPPTFGMYPFDTRLNFGRVIELPRLDDFRLDMPAIRSAIAEVKPRALFLTSPNNPDGSLTPLQEMEELLDLPVLVIVDEAYVEFSDAGGRLGETLTLVNQVPRRQNLVVLRTFSKWAGLAGLRVGYGAFPEWLLDVLWKVKQPYNVNVAASQAAIASLDDLDYLAGNVARIRQERARLFEALCKVPFLRPAPSQANFILCRVVGRSALALKNDLAKQGVLVRYYNTPLLMDAIRITVGRPQDTDALLAALQVV